MIENYKLKQVVASLILGVIASLIANFIYKISFDIAIILFLSVSTISLSFIIVFGYTERKKRIGIRSIIESEKNKISSDFILNNVNTSFYFYGICGFRTVRSNGFKKLIENNRMKKECKFKFLLLNPNSPELLIKAKDEGEDPKSLQHEIEATLTRLENYKQEFKVNIEVRFYDSIPSWRMIFLNENSLYLNQFLSGNKGTSTPQIIIEKGEKYSLYISFYKTFINDWQKAIPNI